MGVGKDIKFGAGIAIRFGEPSKDIGCFEVGFLSRFLLLGRRGLGRKGALVNGSETGGWGFELPDVEGVLPEMLAGSGRLGEEALATRAGTFVCVEAGGWEREKDGSIGIEL